MQSLRRATLILVLICLVIAPSLSSNAQGTGQTYTVVAGDNLFRISLRFGVTVAAMQQANGITNPNLIFVGQVLQIPAGGTPVTPQPGQPTPVPATPPPGGTVGTYVVQPGDTLSRIAVRFNTTVAAIAQANGIANPNLIFVGQSLKIAGAPGTGTTPGGNPPPPSNVGGFELGGQVVGDLGSASATMQSAKMKWVKRQLVAGDANAPNLINQAHGLGYKILFSVIGDKNGVTNGAYQDSYANYVGGLAANGADAVEVWNEMNIDREWPTGQISPTIYVSLLSKSYAAIKSRNANTMVISGAPAPTGAEGAFGLASVWNDDRYYNGMAAAGVGSYADCIGVHYNEGIVSPTQTSGDPRDNYPTRYYATMLNRAMAGFPGKKACFTELGYLTPEGYGPLPASFSWAANTTVAQQALWLGQAVGLASSGGRVRLLIIFNVDSTNYTTDPQAGYAMIRPGGAGCPSCSQIAAALP